MKVLDVSEIHDSGNNGYGIEYQLAENPSRPKRSHIANERFRKNEIMKGGGNPLQRKMKNQRRFGSRSGLRLHLHVFDIMIEKAIGN